VRFHNTSLFISLVVDKLNAAVTGSNEHVTVHVVDGSNHTSEGDSLLGGHRGALPNHNISVLTASKEHIINTADRGNVTSLMSRHVLVKRVVLPDKDLTVLATSVESSIGIGSTDAVGHASEVSVVGTVDSLVFLLLSVEVPELDMLGASSAENVRARSS